DPSVTRLHQAEEPEQEEAAPDGEPQRARQGSQGFVHSAGLARAFVEGRLSEQIGDDEEDDPPRGISAAPDELDPARLRRLPFEMVKELPSGGFHDLIAASPQ